MLYLMLALSLQCDTNGKFQGVTNNHTPVYINHLLSMKDENSAKQPYYVVCHEQEICVLA